MMKRAFGAPLLGLCLAATGMSVQADNDYRGSGPGRTTAFTVDAGPGIRLQVAGTYETGIFDESAAEIAAYDPRSKQIYVTNASANTIDIVSIRNIRRPRLTGVIDLSPYGGGVNSVAVMDGLVAVAVEADIKTDPGKALFFTRGGRFIDSVEVGALPDMLTFTPDGNYVLVANEGEPNDDYTIDPEGSVSVIDLRTMNVATADFTAFNGNVPAGVRVFGPGASAAQDFEPEYITVSADSSTAWVALQENNAIAIVDIASATVTDVVALGTKDHSAIQNAMDASNRDGGINIKPWPVVGMYQPDAIAAYEVDGQTYIVTANEGDARDYDGFSEEARIGDVNDDFFVDPIAYPDLSILTDNAQLGRLTITTATGDTDGDGDIESHPRLRRSLLLHPQRRRRD
jgi:DNA-binding beta-propeller fold protein YncE